jgi:hypothetical protein
MHNISYKVTIIAYLTLGVQHRTRSLFQGFHEHLDTDSDWLLTEAYVCCTEIRIETASVV